MHKEQKQEINRFIYFYHGTTHPIQAGIKMAESTHVLLAI